MQIIKEIYCCHLLISPAYRGFELLTNGHISWINHDRKMCCDYYVLIFRIIWALAAGTIIFSYRDPARYLYLDLRFTLNEFLFEISYEIYFLIDNSHLFRIC